MRDPVTGQEGQAEGLVTDLEDWFMAFADARNQIIHEGTIPPLLYDKPHSGYTGHFVFTADSLFRAAVKASLSGLDPDVWRSAT